jgi:hypothetical protein
MSVSKRAKLLVPNVFRQEGTRRQSDTARLDASLKAAQRCERLRDESTIYGRIGKQVRTNNLCWEKWSVA